MAKFKIGDKVRCKTGFYKGAVGLIIAAAGSSMLGVEFYEKRGKTHTCEGKGKPGHCWWCDRDDIEHTGKHLFNK